MHIDSMSTLDMVRTVNQEDAAVTQAVETALPDIARLIDGICERLQNGGSLYYIGAGTSGRLGVLDASECPPTYGVSPLLVQGIIAGGDSALRDSSESAEDSPKTESRIYFRTALPPATHWWDWLPADARPMSSERWTMPAPSAH